MEQEEVLVGIIGIAGQPVFVGQVYEGPYAYTPTNEIQTIQIANKTAIQNITINKIPSNYGLVTWNGITLTVS